MKETKWISKEEPLDQKETSLKSFQVMKELTD